MLNARSPSPVIITARTPISLSRSDDAKLMSSRAISKLTAFIRCGRCNVTIATLPSILMEVCAADDALLTFLPSHASFCPSAADVALAFLPPRAHTSMGVK